MFEGEKTSLFWAGLVVLGLASWALFASIWSCVRTLLGLYFFFENIENNLPAIVGSVVFVLIGLLMMKSGVAEKPISVSSQEVLILFRGEKPSVFWAGLIILGLAFVAGFAEIWTYRSFQIGVSIDFGPLLLDCIALIVGAIILALTGLYMIKSGVKKDKPST